VRRNVPKNRTAAAVGCGDWFDDILWSKKRPYFAVEHHAPLADLRSYLKIVFSNDFGTVSAAIIGPSYEPNRLPADRARFALAVGHQAEADCTPPRLRKAIERSSTQRLCNPRLQLKANACVWLPCLVRTCVRATPNDCEQIKSIVQRATFANHPTP
jgi:hypothetical protein